MEKFKFSMQKVLEYNTHMENMEKNVLGGMRTQYKELCNKKELLYKKYKQYQNDLAEKVKEGVDAREIIIFNQYIAELQKQIELLLSTIENYKEAINRQIDKLVGISRSKCSMEKLRDKHFSIYQTKQRKEDEIFIEEFIANARFSRSSKVS
jgi:flagellar export protein FliJ